jgi:hypothetical protein
MHFEVVKGTQRTQPDSRSRFELRTFFKYEGRSACWMRSVTSLAEGGGGNLTLGKVTGIT